MASSYDSRTEDEIRKHRDMMRREKREMEERERPLREAARLKRQKLSELWERNYGMDSMDFFYSKCVECLESVTAVNWDSEWMKGAFDTFRTECKRLRSQLETAKLTEHGLKMWNTAIFDTHINLKVACEPYAPNAVRGTSGDYRRLEGINRTLNTCRDVIKEMLRILNPNENAYKVWDSAQEREQFLKDIGFLKHSDCKMDSLLSKLAAISGEHVTCEFITYR
jgi:hypothetical protein